MSASKYLEETEPAVRHLFTALEHYVKLNPRQNDSKKRKNGTPQARREVIKYLGKGHNGAGRDIAKATICGAIVHMAYSGIRQYSKSGTIPRACTDLEIPAEDNSAKFYIGRKIHGIPMGLIVYAAQQQFSNWEEGTPSNQTAKSVFEHLRSVRKKDIWQDLIYELDWPAKRPVSHHVLLQELNWHAYEDYLADMQQALLVKI